MNTTLTRYWLEFEDPATHRAPRPGCGITAHSLEDALAIIGQAVFLGRDVPPTTKIVEDVDVSTLDQGHVVPNMEAPIFRGIWYPKGYTFLR